MSTLRQGTSSSRKSPFSVFYVNTPSMCPLHETHQYSTGLSSPRLFDETKVHLKTWHLIKCAPSTGPLPTTILPLWRNQVDTKTDPFPPPYHPPLTVTSRPFLFRETDETASSGTPEDPCSFFVTDVDREGIFRCRIGRPQNRHRPMRRRSG